jgi:hypothetical protein
VYPSHPTAACSDARRHYRSASISSPPLFVSVPPQPVKRHSCRSLTTLHSTRSCRPVISTAGMWFKLARSKEARHRMSLRKGLGEGGYAGRKRTANLADQAKLCGSATRNRRRNFCRSRCRPSGSCFQHCHSHLLYRPASFAHFDNQYSSWILSGSRKAT